MTAKEAAIAAFELREPEGLVPHFELQFQLGQELLGESHIWDEHLKTESQIERERLLQQNAELYVKEAERLDYCIIPINYGPGDHESLIWTVNKVYETLGDKRLVAVMMDPTMGIPNGQNMMDVVMQLADNEVEVKSQQAANVKAQLEYVKPLRDAGASVALMCSDYCFNDGPFLSPNMFREFVTPYLTEAIAGLRELGMYAVKHTDGDIMPILDQLLEANPHAIHSIDPMAGVDLKKVKEMVGHKVALCGNVHCAMMQSGTLEEIKADALRALRDGMPGGGFFFCSSNTPFKGMPLENYLAILEVREAYGRYPIQPGQFDEAG